MGSVASADEQQPDADNSTDNATNRDPSGSGSRATDSANGTDDTTSDSSGGSNSDETTSGDGTATDATDATDAGVAAAAAADATTTTSRAVAVDPRTEGERETEAHAERLRQTRAAQEAYARTTDGVYRSLNRARMHYGAIIGDIIAGGPLTGVDDPRFVLLSDELSSARRTAIESLRDNLRAALEPPRPPPLLNATRILIGDEQLARFAAISEELEGRVDELARNRQDAWTHYADYFHLQAMALTSTFVYALRISPALRDQLHSIRHETVVELRGEMLQLILRLGYWAQDRLTLLDRLPEIVTYRNTVTLVWDLSKFALLLLALFWALRRWDDWMTSSIEIVGRSLTYGQWALLFVRVAESAKSFGPSLLVLGAALASYRIFSSVSPELDLALELIIAISAVRVQLRLVESIAERLERRRIEREHELALLEAEAFDNVEATPDASPQSSKPGGQDPGDRPETSGGSSDEAPKVDDEDDEDDEERRKRRATAAAAAVGMKGRDAGEATRSSSELVPFWTLFSRTWKRLTRYVAVFLVLMVATHFAVGPGVFYNMLLRWAWLGAIPLSFFFLRTWRARIVHELTVRSKGDDAGGLLGRLARRHSTRIYGIPIVFAAFVVVIGRRSASFVKRHFFELDSTKRTLAFLFRRRVQKHAREHGRVLEKPSELPPAIEREFGELKSNELLPLQKTLFPELRSCFQSWQDEGIDGSVALVGPSGVGKTCVMESFAEELPAELTDNLCFIRLQEKITEPHALVRWLATELDIEATSERELVNRLRHDERRIIMIDSSHHLFLRRVGGFDAWETFVRIVNETCTHVFWVLSFGRAAWEYLANVSGRVAYFRRIIKMPSWSETDLRRLILGRMRRSGYKVNFNDLLVTRLEGVQMNSQIIRTSQGYFRLLWDYSNGNPTLASFFWLRSLVPSSEERSVRVNLFAAPSIAELEQLPDDIAFVLTAIVEHQSASASELALITNLPIELCRFAVRFGRERGYLEKSGRRVVISRLWRQTIVTYLKRKHLLYS